MRVAKSAVVVRWLLPALVLILAACGGLAGEPRIVATIAPTITPLPVAQEVGYPSTAPDLAQGETIFAARCTRCHGEGGRGDGELIGDGQGQIPIAPRDFTDPATTADQTPLQWFTTITNGKLDTLMPPWRDELSEAERWAVTMYSYTLHYGRDAAVQGASIWNAQNAVPASLPSQAQLVNLTDADLLAQVAPESFAELGAEEQRAAAAYVRAQTLANTSVLGVTTVAQAATPAAPAATEEASAPATSAAPAVETTQEAAPTINETMTVTGAVTHGSAGGVVPSDLVVTLHIFDAEFIDTPIDAPLNADGTFTFADVPIAVDNNYVATVRYLNRVFGSEFLPGDPTQSTMDLPITIFELTSDPADIVISAMVSQVSAIDQNLQVAQVISFANTSDRVFTTDVEFGEDAYGSVSIHLPLGARVLGFADNQQRYQISEDGRTVYDTAPVMPGEGHIMHVIYSMPYEGSIDVEHTINFATGSNVQMLLAPNTLNISSDQFVDGGMQALRDITYHRYDAAAPFAAGTTLRYTISGASAAGSATTSAAGSTNVVTADNLLPVLLIIGGVVVVVVGVLLYLRERARAKALEVAGSGQARVIDGLVGQIAELDAQHEAGTIDTAAYERRRARLKARLDQLMDEDEA